METADTQTVRVFGGLNLIRDHSLLPTDLERRPLERKRAKPQQSLNRKLRHRFLRSIPQHQGIAWINAVRSTTSDCIQ